MISKIKNQKNLLFFLLLIFIITIPAIVGLVHKGFPLTDDGTWMIIRFSAFFQALKDGQFPVRFLPNLNNGYGYPVANFLYPLFMYIGTPIHILGFSFVNTIKIILGFSLVFSGIFSFFWLSKIFKKSAALVGSVAYVFSPYLLYDVYKRGSVGEVLALSIVPFIFWQIERKSLFWSSLGIAALIVSHNVLALLFLPIIFIYSILKTYQLKNRKTSICRHVKVFIFGLGISAFFWIPALLDKQYTVFDKTTVSNYANYFVTDFALLGIFSAVIILLSIPLLFKSKNIYFHYFFILSVIFSFLTLSVSSFVWENFPFVNLIQFPFRLLSVVIFSISFLIAFQLDFINKSKLKFLIPLCLLLIFIFAVPFISPTNRNNYPDSFYSTNQDTTTVKKEYMPKWVKKELDLDKQPIEILKGEGSFQVALSKSNKINFNLTCKTDCFISLKKVYFPGWKVYVDSQEAKVDYNREGLIEFKVDKGEHNISVVFKETRNRAVADLISVAFIFLIIFQLKFKFSRS
ncbi:YfhO family protein [Patescibacteria group bacterium]|nr:YfhO family protein [Patescibacteria group bacterium]